MPEYQPTVQSLFATFGDAGADPSEPQVVADAIWGAVTDGTDVQGRTQSISWTSERQKTTRHSSPPTNPSGLSFYQYLARVVLRTRGLVACH
jgi:hypothetical protein